MARDEEKQTIGTWMESKVQGTIRFTGFGAGGFGGLMMASNAPHQAATSPEAAAVTAGAIGSLATGAVAGSKIVGQLNGNIAERIDNLKPARFQDGELYLSSQDPFDLRLENKSFNDLEEEKLETVKEQTGSEQLSKFDLYQMDNENDQVEEWVSDMIYGDINGFQGEFKTNVNYSGSFKTGYVDKDNEVFIQAPRNGDTFDEAMEKVQTWKENKETLDQAEQYLDQVLSEDGTKTVSTGLIDIEIDYDFLNEHEDKLREEVEEGIITPSKNYDIVVTSHNGQPFPVLVGDYNSEMVERTRELYELENSEEVQKRKQVLGMYMDALIAQGEFEGHLGDFWYDGGYGREGTKNMFYDQETDTVGVTDIGEHMGEKPDKMPDINLEERYA